MKRLIKRSTCAVITLCLVLGMLSCALVTNVAASGNLAKVGDTEYATLQAALDNASAGATITMLGNVDTYLNVTKDIVLDLNGYTLTSANGGNDVITLSNGNITIYDNSEAKTGRVHSSYNNDSNKYEPTLIWSKNNNKKKATIYGGTWTMAEDVNSNGGVLFAANVDIYGGTFSYIKTGSYQTKIFDNSFTVNLYGGTFNDNRVTPASDHVYVDNGDGTYTVVSTLHDHDYSVFVETVAPTYTEQGYDVYKCSICGLTEKRNYVDRIIAYSDWSITAGIGGTVFINGAAVDSSVQYEVGSTATLTVQADEGYGFVQWEDGEGNVVSTKSTYELTFGETTSLVAVFSDDIDTILSNELASLINTMMDGFVSDQWTLNGNINIDANGKLNAHRRGGQTATSVNTYNVSNGFTLSGNMDFTGKGWHFNASYIKVGSLKILFSVSSGTSPVYLEIYNGDTLLATSSAPIAGQYNATNALKKNYVFSVDADGLLTITADDAQVAFGSEDNYAVDVSGCDLSNANVVIYQGWSSDPNGGYATHSNFKFYSTFPYTTVADFTAFLSSLNKGSSLATISSAKALYNVVMENGSDGLKEAIEPYYSYITAAESLTWADVDVLTDENGSILIDGAAYNATATLTAGTTHTVTAVPDTHYNFVAFVDADGNVLSEEATYEFVASADTYIRATYIAKVYSTWSVTSTDGGKVLIDGADIDTSVLYEVGTEAILTTEAEEGYVFLYWKDAQGAVVSSDLEFVITFENNTTYQAVFSNNPDDILDYELSTIRDVKLDTYIADEWVITNGGNNGYSNIKNGSLFLSTRKVSTATSVAAYNLSTGFELSGHFDFRSHGHKMGGETYIQVGNLQIQYSTSGTTNPVYLKAIDTATNTTIATSNEAVSDTFTSDLMNADVAITVDNNGVMTVKYNGNTVLWGDSRARTLDVSAVDFSNAKVIINLCWVSASDYITNECNGIKLQQSIPYSTVAEFQQYVDDVDTDDKAAFETGKHLVAVVRALGSDELNAKIDDFNFYKAKYDIGAIYGGKVQLNGADFVNDYRYDNRLAVGTVLNLTAVANAGYTFAYWADAEGAVKSYDANITVILGDKATTVSAVFTKDSADAGENVTISFQNRSGKVISAVTVAKGTVVTLPELNAASMFGYTVNGWVINGEIVTAGTVTADKDMIISADYSKADTVYTVEVIGATENVDGKYSYNDIITVTFDADALTEGEYFGGWRNDAGTVVSYNENYSFYVGSDVILYAVTSEFQVEDAPAISVTDASLINGGAEASFLTERYIPEGYTFVTAGVIYTASDDFSALTLDTVNGTTIRSKAVASINGCGQYRQTIGSTAGATLNVSLAAYLTYVDLDGNMNTIYSSTYALTINQ